ncbi:MAG: protein TolR [Alphaproteobacteria bacterium]
MGMSLGSGPGRARGGRHRRQPMSEINVTPFVDVMLVLLIIFMVAAPLMNSGVEVNLPKTVAGEMSPSDDQPVNISVQADGQLYLSEDEITIAELTAKIEAVRGVNKDVRILIRGDENVDYGKVMEVISILNKAGYSKIGMLTRPAAVETTE